MTCLRPFLNIRIITDPLVTTGGSDTRFRLLGCHATQDFDGSRENVEELVDIFFRIKATETESYCRTSERIVEAEGADDR
jgi:hypothetical protein